MAIVKAIIVAFLVKLGADEAKAWLPALAEWLVGVAVNRLDECERERYREEWSADLLTFPGEISKCVRALGMVCAGLRIGGMGIGPKIGAALSRVRGLRALERRLGAVFETYVLGISILLASVTENSSLSRWIHLPGFIYWVGIPPLIFLLFSPLCHRAISRLIGLRNRYSSRPSGQAQSPEEPGQIVGARAGERVEKTRDHC